MLARSLLLSLSLWLMIAGGLAAHAGPCHVQDGMKSMTASAPVEAGASHDHCDMMAEAAPEHPSGDMPGKAPAADGICCCPAVLAALPAPALPQAAAPAFSLPASFPLDARAPSRTLIPEPPPPKA